MSRAQSTLFGLPLSESGRVLIDKTAAHVELLREAGVLGPAHELEAALVSDLAESLVRAPGYSKAALAQQLTAAIDRLPVLASDDAWDSWATLARNLHTPRHRTAPPLYATQPTPGAAHAADGVALVAALLGKPLMPWQYQVVRVATELTPDGTRPRYRRVLITVPRQSGKTTLLAAVFAHRALTSFTRVWMTAQTGKDATARWNDLRKLVETSQLGPFTHARLSAGSALLTFLRNESTIGPFAPTPESLHGYTFDRAAVDEAFAFTVDQGRDLVGAIEPAMITIPDRQLWITSTAGSPESTWLRSLVDHGRTQTGVSDSSVAYFEWAGNRADDPDDPASYAFHPAVGHTISIEDLVEAAGELPPTERDRAFRNLWTDSTTEPLLPLDKLRAGYRDVPPPPVDGSVRVAIGFDVDADGQHSAIYSAWTSPAGEIVATQLAARPGMAWLVDELRDAVEAAGPAAELVTPPDGPSLETVALLSREGIDCRVLNGSTWALACGALHRALTHQALPLPADTELEAAVNGAATRPMGDAWAISRHRSTASVSPWGALAAAVRHITDEGTEDAPLIEGAEE